VVRMQSKSLFAFAPAHIVAVMCGLLDSSVWIGAYDNGSYFFLYSALAVACKALILLIFLRTVRLSNARLLWSVYLSIVITVCASIIQGTTNFEGVIQPVGVLISLTLTLMVLSDENITLYMKAFGISCFVCCLVFLFQVNFVPLNTSGVLYLYGRYSFIFGTQPNLGGEILFTGFIAFCIARINTKIIFSIFALYFTAIYLLESRTAMLSMMFAFSLYMYVEKIRWLAPINRVLLTSMLVVLIVSYCVLNIESISNLFLLEDTYRGIGTGFVGRAEHWESAWNIFLEYPLFGIGFGYFRHDVVTPHSMWLGMLSMMGLMSFFILAAILQNGWRIYNANAMVFLFLLSFIPMTILNDRFLNLNPYPFLLFVLLFLPRKALTVDIQWRELRSVRHRGIRAKTA
jgi:hypothetical protein